MHRPHHGRYANVIASLALFVALGGTGVAAVTLERDSVGSPRSALTPSAPRRSERACARRRSAAAPSAPPRSATRASTRRHLHRGAHRAARRTEGRGGRALPRTRTRVREPTCPYARTSSSCGSPPRRRRGRAAVDRIPNPTVPGGTPPGPQVAEPGRNWLVQAKLHIVVAKPVREVGTPSDSTGTQQTDPEPVRPRQTPPPRADGRCSTRCRSANPRAGSRRTSRSARS